MSDSCLSAFTCDYTLDFGGIVGSMRNNIEPHLMSDFIFTSCVAEDIIYGVTFIAVSVKNHHNMLFDNNKGGVYYNHWLLCCCRVSVLYVFKKSQRNFRNLHLIFTFNYNKYITVYCLFKYRFRRFRRFR